MLHLRIPSVIFSPTPVDWGKHDGTVKLPNGQSDNDYFHGGAEITTTTLGASVTLKFNGESIYLERPSLRTTDVSDCIGSHIYCFGDGNSDHGQFTVTLDNKTFGPLTTFNAAGPQPGVMYFDSATDPSVPHSITITNAEGGKHTPLDYFLWVYDILATICQSLR